MLSGRQDPHETSPDEYSASQEEIARHSRDTGGDAPAAASLAEREALARGDRPLFEDIDEDETEHGQEMKAAEGER